MIDINAELERLMEESKSRIAQCDEMQKTITVELRQLGRDMSKLVRASQDVIDSWADNQGINEAIGKLRDVVNSIKP